MVTFWVVAFAVTCLLMTVNVLKGNYPKMKIRRVVVTPASLERTIPSRKRKINPENRIEKEELAAFKKNVNDYFYTEKPYLNSKLKLEELAQEMGYTRNQFSALVNQSFKVNFNVFVNNWRLKELENIAKAPKTKKLSRARQAEMAGFGSYDSYQRAEHEATAAKTKRRRKPKDNDSINTSTSKE